jgi:hypothetical protein
MSRIENRLAELEGQIIAHRRLLARLIDALDAAQRRALLRWIDEREILRDGQEDPGAVPTGAEILPLSTAAEFRELAEMLRASDK